MGAALDGYDDIAAPKATKAVITDVSKKDVIKMFRFGQGILLRTSVTSDFS